MPDHANQPGSSGAPFVASDDDESAAPGGSGSQSKSQRSAKACDRCRKSKSKCEPARAEGQPCKSCAAIGAECTYTAPSFRRGPPKGYIQALEHRLHQVESVLAAIMSSTDIRSRSVIDELRKDELAAHILETVNVGPFGRAGREKRSIDPTKDNFFSSIVTDRPKAQSHRSRRESRATRETVIENVISRDPHTQTTRPTLAWQDRLSERLAASFGGSTPTPPPMHRPVTLDSHLRPDQGLASEPPKTRRRLDVSAADSVQLIPPYVSHDGSVPTPGGDEDLTDCADAFGNLSIDENREVRYHGNSSGLHLLVQAERTDGRAIKGIWNFPMAKIWPGPHPLHSAAADPRSSNLEIRLPPEREQRRLLDVYFKYVNPAVPIIDEETFMSQYETMCVSRSFTTPRWHHPMENDIKPEQPQKLSDLLLFAVFACAASYIDPLEREGRRMSADEYAACARRVLDTMYHESRSSTVQALLLLGVRGFGTGVLEEGWLHVGMAIRMALDLGMNRNPDKWMHNGRELFSIKEKEIRKRIWWSCCIVDKFSALFLGRTIAIHEKDFSTPLLEVPEDDLDQLWRPSHLDPRSHTISPVPGAYRSYLRYMASLYVITGEVVANVYRVSRTYNTHPRVLRQQYYNRLLQWALDLPEHLNYSATSTRPCPAPHILAMHIQYWASVVLLHRPFIPKGTELARADSPSLDPDPIPWESYDICQSAATQIASLATVYHETYDMRWAPPFLANCLQTAGIMHVLTLKYKPLDAQASASLQKCINALAGMEVTWAMALRVRHLIQNAKVNIDQSHAAAAGARQKRTAHTAFEHDGFVVGSSSAPASVPAQVYAPLPPQRSSAPPMRPAYPAQSYVVPSQPAHTQPQSYTSSQMAYVPQSDVARGVPSYAGYAPGYDTWWSPADAQANVVQSDPVRSQNVGLAMHARAPQAPVQVSAPPDGTGVAVPGNAGVAQRLPSQEFTFGQEHFTPEFLQAMRDPVLHFPSVFAPQR
ncbi:hypothetical protein PYCCODRAFT_1373230 [Trametes coccinea BRFM310]|uniref:Zn(2)-C6 fungal-type domain-containing protein n=1 Tax=Trametes coccinea (strain BRFM310) TaxID=1353009 RepID=A0A1Y2IE17_TRAC3|nr:hypothetical protein PYCCODRAFT_1373230 [Trametes coccinea BRFM310]